MDHEIIIVGAGFSGICLGVKLDEAGIGDYRILEGGDGVGGTWHWNTYPGIGVDFPSFSYQYSFEKRTDWTRTYAKGAELKAYADDVVDKHGLRPKIRFNTRVNRIEFDEDRHLWRLSCADGAELTARFVLNATGALSEPSWAPLAGLADFAGPCFHTARWDHGVELAAKRVGIVGTGASAVQIVPSIAGQVQHLTVFQRTPIWCLGKLDKPISPGSRWTLSHVPGAELLARGASQAMIELFAPVAAQYNAIFPIAGWAERSARRMLQEQVRDPAVREKLTPRYAFGCKRPSFSNDYLPTFNRDNVLLETAGIDRVTETGIRTVEGVEHRLDVLIMATGFRLGFDPDRPYECVGAGGAEMTKFFVENRSQAYEGVSVPGFPNLFAVFGPYGYNGASYFTLIEASSRHILRCLREARRRGATRVEISEQANRRYFERVLGRRRHQVFWQDSCQLANSYYFDANGDVPVRPSLTAEVHWRSGHFDLNDYRWERLAG